MNQVEIEPTKRLELIYEQAQQTAKTCVNNAIPIKRLVRSSQELTRMSGIYETEKNYVEAYFLALKTVFIFQFELKHHSQFKTLDQTVIKMLKSRVVNALQIAERTKPKVSLVLEKQYIDWKNNAAKTPTIPPAPAKNVESPAVPVRNSSFRSQPRLLYPANLVPTFKHAVAENSVRNNVETCGFLFGSVSGNTYTLTHLFIPKQTGTADTCQPTDEGELEMFEVLSSLNLVQLGWIHTHPSQTAFLSSVDMHTHFSYQSLLPVAIAIVCSIKYDETKFLHLTELGMTRVREKLNTTQSGQFTNYSEDRAQLQQDCNFTEATNQLQIVTIDKR